MPSNPATPSGPGSENAEGAPHLQQEEDVPTDGTDPEGERMIEDLGKEPHVQKPQEGG